MPHETPEDRVAQPDSMRGDLRELIELAQRVAESLESSRSLVAGIQEKVDHMATTLETLPKATTAPKAPEGSHDEEDCYKLAWGGGYSYSRAQFCDARTPPRPPRRQRYYTEGNFATTSPAENWGFDLGLWNAS